MTAAQDQWLIVKVLPIKQPIGEFFIGVMRADDLAHISFADERHLNTGDRKDQFAEYLGIQRPLNKKRVPEIAEFVLAEDASFPSTIILAIGSSNVQWDGKALKLKYSANTATVLDGQHRIAGLRAANRSEFEVPVTIFIDMTLEMQAHVFSTINTKQTRINPSLAKDLLAFSAIETPEKVVHHIARGMHSDQGGPFYGLIKVLGTREKGSEALLTQHTFVEHVVSLIYRSDDHNALRRELQRANNKRQRMDEHRYPPNQFPLFSLYRAEDDSTIYQILTNYFNAIKAEFPDAWGNPQSILTKTTGFHALIIALRPLLIEGLNRNDVSPSFFGSFARNARRNLEASDKSLIASDWGLGAAAARRLADLLVTDYEPIGKVT